ncbi:MAG: metal ABC transporter substrate-binding protein [Chromatiales bacterium]|nr:metal ABC transporter substrate-binding protein [Chromatiales bacterium]MDH4031598.1 metal ABC transporter substrate-binding protein [Chromatiales bacterium]
MNRKTRPKVSWLALLFIGTASCGPSDDAATTAETTAADGHVPTVYAVNYPLAWMAGRVGGDAVEVRLPVPDGVDPAHWQPAPETILAYQDADRVLLNGAGYAGWIRFASLSPGKLVDTSRGLDDRLVPAGGTTHSHGPGGEHDHGDVASHTWLDPTFAIAQARAIANALIDLAPDRKTEMVERLNVLQAELTGLDGALAQAFSGLPAAGILYSHPVYQYLDARYGLAGRSVSWEPGQDPGEAGWQALAQRLRERPAAVMLWEGEPLAATADRLRGMGVEPVVFETGAAQPAMGDYLALMNENRHRVASLELVNQEDTH